jgi:hypothetical protein
VVAAALADRNVTRDSLLPGSVGGFSTHSGQYCRSDAPGWAPVRSG